MTNTMTFKLTSDQIDQITLTVHQIIMRELNRINNYPNKSLRYLNKTQTCEYLGITNNTLDKWIKTGLPKISLGKIIRFNRIKIDEFLSEHVC